MENETDNLIEIRFRSEDAISDERDLQQYLERALEVKLRQELMESVHLPHSAFFLAPAAVPIAKYAGKKLIDLLTDLLRKWLLQKPKIPEIVLYGADGEVVTKVSRK